MAALLGDRDRAHNPAVGSRGTSTDFAWPPTPYRRAFGSREPLDVGKLDRRRALRGGAALAAGVLTGGPLLEWARALAGAAPFERSRGHGCA